MSGFARDPSAKYEMPIVFGPTEIPDLSRWGEVDMVSTSFVTTFDAARSLVPAALDVPERPVVTVSRMSYRDVDYLAGRGYNEVTVGITVSHSHEGVQQRGSFMPVVWVDDFRPIIIGREFIGYAKLGADFSDVTDVDGASHASRGYEISEYGTRLVRGDLSGLMALEGDDLQAVQQAASIVTVFGWKHIAGPQNTVDADYLTRTPLQFEWSSVLRGEGAVTFDAPDWKAAPHSSRVLQALRELPVVRQRPALVATGTGSLDRTAVVRFA
jgi:hypothetical protein